jgi:hypothetical protein
MARGRNPKHNSTTQVVDILNHSGNTTAPSPSKRKRESQPARRQVGRPPKRAKGADNENAVATAAAAAPTNTGSEGAEESDGISNATKHSKLRNPKASLSARRQVTTLKMAGGKDVFDVHNSPESAPPKESSRATGQEEGYSLEDSAFDPVPEAKEARIDMNMSHSRFTRSKINTGPPSKEDISLPGLGKPTHLVRNLRPRPADGDLVGDESLEATSSVIRALQIRKTRSKQLPASDAPSEKGRRANSENFAYPSPGKQSMARKARANVADRLVTVPAVVHGKVSSKSRGSIQPTPDSRIHGSQGGAGGETGEEILDPDEEDVEDIEEEIGVFPDAEVENGGIVPGQDSERHQESNEERVSETRQGEGNDTIAVGENQQPQSQSPRTKFQVAAELNDCGEYWNSMWRAARENKESGNPHTEPVRELAIAIDAYKEGLVQKNQDPQSETEDEMDSVIHTSDIDEIATLLGNLRASTSRTGKEERLLIGDIHQQAIPRLIGLLRRILITRFKNGTVSISALNDMIKVLKSTRRLCERLYHWKPGPTLEPGIKKNTHTKVKPALKAIEKRYCEALSELQTTDSTAEIETQELEAREKREMLEMEHEQKILDQRQSFVDWVQSDKAERQRKRMMQSRLHARAQHPSPEPELELYDVDSMDLYDSTPQPADGFDRAARQDVPGPSKRVWQVEETTALMFLLQKHRGPDRFQKIQREISDLARSFRKMSVDEFLRMSDEEVFNIDLGRFSDVLDDLGNMEVADIEQGAKDLKAAHKAMMERDIKATGRRDDWMWLLSV